LSIQAKPHNISSRSFFSKVKSFQLFFLKNDKDQSVEVIETNRIDLEELIKHLKFGESIFITVKKT